MNAHNPYQSAIRLEHEVPLVLPDCRRVLLYPDGRLVILCDWQPGLSPIDFLQHLSVEETKLLSHLLSHYPAVSPFSQLCSPHLRARLAKQRLYGIAMTLRQKLASSGLVPSPVTREGYLLAVSSPLPPQEPLQQCLLNEEMGMTLAPQAKLAVLWQKDGRLHIQRFSKHQMRFLTEIVKEYPDYCSYERLYAQRANLPYDPVTMAQLLQEQPRRKSRIHSSLAPIRKRLYRIGLSLNNYPDTGYQLVLKGQASHLEPSA